MRCTTHCPPPRPGLQLTGTIWPLLVAGGVAVGASTVGWVSVLTALLAGLVVTGASLWAVAAAARWLNHLLHGPGLDEHAAPVTAPAAAGPVRVYVSAQDLPRPAIEAPRTVLEPTRIWRSDELPSTRRPIGGAR